MILKGKTAVITGTNRGIGKCILELFAKEGANIFACTRRKEDSFLNFKSSLEKKYKINIINIVFDFEEIEEIKKGVSEISTFNTKIDILINNAGVASGSIFQMTKLSDIEKSMNINFFRTIYFTQSISRLMSRNKSGSIVNISSVSGTIGDFGTLSYGSSKAALNFATKNMSIELGVFGIRVNAVSPSITNTDMLNEMDEKSKQKFINNSTLKRIAEPLEIANVVLFLASDLSTFVTGQNIRVDGGLLI